MYIWSPPRIHFQLPVTAYANQTPRKGKWNKCNSCRWRHHPPCIRARSPLTLPSNVLCSMNNNSPGTKWSHPKLLKPRGTGFKNKSSIFYFYFAIAIGTGPRFLFLQFGLPKIPYSIRAQPKREYPDLDYRVQINVPSNCKSFTIWLGGENLQNRKSQTAMIKRERQEQNKHKATNGDPHYENWINQYSLYTREYTCTILGSKQLHSLNAEISYMILTKQGKEKHCVINIMVC